MKEQTLSIMGNGHDLKCFRTSGIWADKGREEQPESKGWESGKGCSVLGAYSLTT